MILNLDKKITKIVLNIIDDKFGNIKIGGLSVDKITDLFQGQENKINELERKVGALEIILKDNK